MPGVASRAVLHSRILRPLLTAAVIAAALCGDAQANSPIGAPRGVADPWMPDVRERVDELRERARQATAEARERKREHGPRQQWWRQVAARPGLTVPR
ncbi:MAG: hypothetical protein ABR587_16380 [Candidatus Binatia bacterium]